MQRFTILTLLLLWTIPAQAERWHAKFGGIPKNTLQFEAGFPHAPAIAYTRALGKNIALGGKLLLDYSRYGARGASFSPSGQGMAILRLSSQSEKLSFGFFLEPGVGFAFNNTGSPFITLPVLLEANLGYRLGKSITVGGGLAANLTIGLAANGDLGIALPILLGPIVEIAVGKAQRVSLYWDTRFGPYAALGGGVWVSNFGMRAIFGVAVAF